MQVICKIFANPIPYSSFADAVCKVLILHCQGPSSPVSQLEYQSSDFKPPTPNNFPVFVRQNEKVADFFYSQSQSPEILHDNPHTYIKQDRGWTKFESESKIFFDFDFCMENGKKRQILDEKWNSSVSSSQQKIVSRFVHPLSPSKYSLGLSKKISG